jgi:hypothetical protein
MLTRLDSDIMKTSFTLIVASLSVALAATIQSSSLFTRNGAIVDLRSFEPSSPVAPSHTPRELPSSADGKTHCYGFGTAVKYALTVEAVDTFCSDNAGKAVPAKGEVAVRSPFSYPSDILIACD